MEQIKEAKDWLSNSPLPEEVKVKDGGKYIPYDIIVNKLNALCGHNWSIKNFRELYFTLPKGRILVSGSLELELAYQWNENIIFRTLAGGANFVLDKKSNVHPTATVKSLAVMNAVKPLGVAFAWNLNPKENEVPNIEQSPEDVAQAEKDLIAVMDECGNLEALATWEENCESDVTKNHYKLNKLVLIYNKVTQSKSVSPSIKRIIDNRETASYDKAIKELESL